MTGIKRANTVALEQLGFTKVEELNENIPNLAQKIQTRDLTTGERLRPDEEVFVRGLRGESATREVVVRHLKSGEDKVVRSSSAPIRLDGQVIGAVALNVDITEQKQVERGLRNQEERLRLALDAAQAGLFDDDLVNGQMTWDTRAKALFGARPDTVMTFDKALEAVHPEDRKRVRAALAAAQDPSRNEDYRIDYRTIGLEDGVERWVAARGRCLFDSHGKPERFIGTVLDITDRKRTEDNLRRTADFRDQFIGILGHDLRNPLGAILASAHLLFRQGNLNEPQSRAVARIGNSAEKIDRMIGDVLDFARSRLGGGFVLKPRRVNLHEICRQAIDELHVAHPERKIEFTYKGNGQGTWDADRLAQVVSNLVANAVTYGQADTPIVIQSLDVDGEVLLTVTNQGNPIPSDVISVLFEPFTRASESSGASKSLGLGLYIVKQIVDAHRGTIEVTSNESEGTTFTVRLPRSL